MASAGPEKGTGSSPPSVASTLPPPPPSLLSSTESVGKSTRSFGQFFHSRSPANNNGSKTKSQCEILESKRLSDAITFTDFTPSDALNFMRAFRSNSVSGELGLLPYAPYHLLEWGPRNVSVAFATMRPDETMALLFRYQYDPPELSRRFCARQNRRSGGGENNNNNNSNNHSVGSLWTPFTPMWDNRVRSLCKLRHEHLEPVLDIGMDAVTRQVCVVYPYSIGKTPLALLLRRPPPLPSLLCDRNAVEIVLRVAEAVLHLHRNGFTHGELTPFTVLLCPDGHATIIGYAMAEGRATFPPFGNILDMACLHQRDRWPRVATVEGDTYAVGALLFLLLPHTPQATREILQEMAEKLTSEDPRSRLALSVFCPKLELIVHELQTTPQPPPPNKNNNNNNNNSEVPLSVQGILRTSLSPLLRRRTGLERWRPVAQTHEMQIQQRMGTSRSALSSSSSLLLLPQNNALQSEPSVAGRNNKKKITVFSDTAEPSTPEVDG